MGDQRRVLVIGAGFAGFVVARHMRHHFKVTVIDAKEYFEYTPGILRAFVQPAHFESLTFMLQPVLEEKMGCRFIWGEVKGLDGDKRLCKYTSLHSTKEEEIGWDYCVVAAGCNFGLFNKVGESLWFPSVWDYVREKSEWPQHDERFWQGRRDHIEEECMKLKTLNEKGPNGAHILIVGAGFIGVEWATEIKHFFPNIKITLCDMLDKCLGPLPEVAKDYCQNYMDKVGINCVFKAKYDPFAPDGWKGVSGITARPDLIYISTGFKASCKFMPVECMSQYSATADKNFETVIQKRGPAGGGWIRTDLHLNVLFQHPDGKNKKWGCDDKGWARVFAVGDCNMLGDLPPVPKISYPGEEQAAIACRNIEIIENHYYHKKTHGCWTYPFFWPIVPCYGEFQLTEMWYPWGSGMYATSLGVNDACFVIAGTPKAGSGYMVVWGRLCALQKWFIEWSKIDQCKSNWIGHLTWMTVH